MEKQNVIEELKQTIEQINLTQGGMGIHLNIIEHKFAEYTKSVAERIELIEEKISKIPALHNEFKSDTPLMLVKKG